MIFGPFFDKKWVRIEIGSVFPKKCTMPCRGLFKKPTFCTFYANVRFLKKAPAGHCTFFEEKPHFFEDFLKKAKKWQKTLLSFIIKKRPIFRYTVREAFFDHFFPNSCKKGSILMGKIGGFSVFCSIGPFFGQKKGSI